MDDEFLWFHLRAELAQEQNLLNYERTLFDEPHFTFFQLSQDHHYSDFLVLVRDFDNCFNTIWIQPTNAILPYSTPW